MMKLAATDFQKTLEELTAQANTADATTAWPAESWAALRRAGVLAWSIPPAYGGQGLEGVPLLHGYELLAGACMTACFILSQRDAAIRRICASGHELLCRELLPPLARGAAFATVGLSQLTTSRQHGKPAMIAQLGDGFLVLDGTMPWVTGAAQADHFITGAVLADGRQVLAALPRDAKGVNVRPPLPLMALAGSLTAEVDCDHVVLDRKWILAGPAERVLAKGGAGTGGLETSCLALGLAGSAIAYLTQEARTRPEFKTSAERLEQTRRSVRRELHLLAATGATAEATATLRARANSLVLRASQSALTASKGTGFLRTHPAQRWARQALFFLVWSCPRPAAQATLAYLAADAECESPG